MAVGSPGRRTSRRGSSGPTSPSCSASLISGVTNPAWRSPFPTVGACAASAVLLATGATYQRLGIPALESLNGAGVFYGGTASEAPAMAGREVYVIGGANSAGQAALHLAQLRAHVTLVVRADSLRAGMSQYLVRQSKRHRTSTSASGPRSSTAAAPAGSSTSCSGPRDGKRADRPCRRTVPHDRRTAAHRLAPTRITRDERGFVVTGPDLGHGPGSWIVGHSSSRRACRACSRPETCGTAR